jgi:hypothetical protein
VDACITDSHCDAGGRCVVAGDVALCEGDARALGESCEDSNDCLGAECVSTTGTGPLCTRRCSDQVPCPLGWDCTEEDGRRVCAPPPEPIGGCACRANGRGEGQLPTGLLLWALVGVSVRQKRLWEVRRESGDRR